MMRRLLGAAVVCLLAASALALTEAEARAGGVHWHQFGDHRCKGATGKAVCIEWNGRPARSG